MHPPPSPPSSKNVFSTARSQTNCNDSTAALVLHVPQAVVLLALLLRWDWQREVERVQGLLRQAAASGKVAPSFGH